MGYYTRFELIIKAKNSKEIMADLRATNEDAEFALTEDGCPNEDAKWYSHETDLKEFSKKYPKALFTMYGTGESANDDYWVHYVKDGKGQLEEGKIIYPAYKPLKLK